MRVLRVLASAIYAVTILVCLASVGLAQPASDGPIATVTGGGSSARWDITAANSGGTLTINFPDGRSIRKTFRSGTSPTITIGDKNFDALIDGVYAYEIQLAPSLSPSAKEAAAKARGKDDDPETERAGRKRPSVSAMTQSGSFAVVNGSIIVPGDFEPEQKREPKASTAPVAAPAAAPASRTTASAKVLQRVRNNHRAFFMWDQVIPDDLIVQGSACVGLDCVNGEGFNFDTIRMKENNTRILFLDTSTSAGFSTNDWIIKANDQGSGGASYLGIVDHGNTGTGADSGTIIAQFTAGAPANSINVASNGKVGFRTATPVLDLHMNTSDTPAVRFEQTNAGGFSAQTWDVAGNEANFFVRDVTSGSRLPFRIRPGAPTSSIDISASGQVGIGTASPGTLNATTFSSVGLHVKGTGGSKYLAVDDSNLVGFLLNDSSQAVDSRMWGLINQSTRLSLSTVTDAGSPTERVSVLRNGRVGIGTTAPDQVFSVNGDASKTGGGSWQIFSDERLKHIKGRFNSGLNAVMRLQPLRYEYKPDNALGLKSAGEHIGFRAQELQKVIPEAVSTSDGGFLMVNNDPILWTMLNAIKEQQQEIAELKAQVRKLQTTSRKRRR